VGLSSQVFIASPRAPLSAASALREALLGCHTEVLRRGLAAFLAPACERLDRRSYALLEATRGGCEAWLICWPPGTGAPWHDHGSARGIARVLRGSLREERQLPCTTRALRRAWRTDDVIELPQGVRHDVQNATRQAAYSIHVYDPQLLQMTFYQREVGGMLRPLRTEQSREW
jgi:predicted metal-dependent enzyme (double-stranded beta helix superfamily)